MKWLRRLFYRWRVQWVVSNLKAQDICACEMCLGSVMRHGIGRCAACKRNQSSPCEHL